MARFPHAPKRILRLPVDHRGFPVPWFVAWIGGAPDFRVIGPGKVEGAVLGDRCWLCGDGLGRFKAFVIGPMCAVNRISSEPPSHIECAIFAAEACPFLSQPRMRRNEKDMPSEALEAPGIMLKRNPGVALVWVTKGYRLRREARGVLFQVGDPDNVLWFAEGRAATRAEIMASIDSGLPALKSIAERQGRSALAQFARQYADALQLLPAA